MNQTCKIAKSLLKGEVISILTGFQRFFITNVPREIGRLIERPFGVEVDKKQKNFTNKDGESGYYFEYRLLRKPCNLEGIAKLETYVREKEQSQFQSSTRRGAKTKHIPEPLPTTSTQKIVQKDLFSNL